MQINSATGLRDQKGQSCDSKLRTPNKTWFLGSRVKNEQWLFSI